MLQFVLGRAGSGKTYHQREFLIHQYRQGERNLMMLVPEQYSFETEKAMLQMAGPKAAAEIQVYSFTRLCDAVFRKEGGFTGSRLSEGGRRILMSQAIEASLPHLELYEKAASAGRITDLMLTAVNEMKMCGIRPDTLQQMSGVFSENGLGKKLGELSLVYGTYEALVGSAYLDTRDDLTRLADKLEESCFFEDAVVAVDSFDGFTAQELRVLGLILQKAKIVSVSLCTDDLPDHGAGLFTLVNRTKSKLTLLAQQLQIPVAAPVHLTGAPRFQNDSLKLVEAGLFEGDAALQSQENQGIHLFCGKDSYEESEFAAAVIRALVSTGKYRYRDFLVVCREPEQYYSSLEISFHKRDIPCFLSHPMAVDAEPLMRFVLGSFQAVLSGYPTETLLELLKTGLSGFTTEEISDLENYAYIWKINGNQWKEPFTRHPKGFGYPMEEGDLEEIHHLDQLRQRLLLPLQRFSGSMRGKTGKELSKAVFQLLEDFNMEDNLKQMCRVLEQAGETFLAAKQVRVWELLMEILQQMYDLLGDQEITGQRYHTLLQEVVSGEDISEIPQTLDQVIFGTPEQVRQSSPKVTFLLGAVQGKFPLTPSASGVFSDVERKELIQAQLPLGDPLELKTLEERYLAYSCACSSSQLLYVTYPASAEGTPQEPSELVSGLMQLFPALQVEKNLPDEFFANTKEAAFARMAAKYQENTGESMALQRLFAEDTAYQGKCQALQRAAQGRPEKIQDPENAKALFGSSPYLSATQIETFYNCRFRYFCRYGLGAKERRAAEVDAMQYGTLMHFLFEKVFSQAETEGLPETEEALFRLITQLIHTYAEENLGGFDSLGGKERYRLGRLAKSAAMLIRHMAEELSQSQFRPAAFELKLGSDGTKPLQVPVDGANIIVGGTVDRVDLYKDKDGVSYLRVVDYKTGKKEFKLGDVLGGLNMQMLVYLAALAAQGEEEAAGILYMPSAEPSVSAQRGDSQEQVEKDAAKQLRMSGVVLSDPKVILAMEKDGGGKYIPASLTKDGNPTKISSVLDKPAMKQVMDYCKFMISQMAKHLLAGDVQAKPNLENNFSCRFCPYKPVCGKEFEERDMQRVKRSREEILEEMEVRMQGEEETE